MSVLFITSCPGGDKIVDGRWQPDHLNASNDFTKRLKAYWKLGMRILIMASSPDNFEINDQVVINFCEAFRMDGFPVEEILICDHRHPEYAKELKSFGMVLLAGGHVPTQHRFFEEVQLREQLKEYDGIILSLSAGSMNSAKEVYALPEIEGESTDPSYVRFFSGLGLTKRQIIPHFQCMRNELLDGKHVIEEIAAPDSMGREFLCLEDGAYIEIVDGEEKIMGPAYILSDGILKTYS